MRWRRWAAAALAAAAALVTIGALRPPAAEGSGVPTVVVVRDVAAGTVVSRNDVEVVARAPAQRPESALSGLDGAVGRMAATPLVVHEVVTAERLVGADLLAGQPADRVAVSVPVLDASSVGVRPGSRVDLYATGTGEPVAVDVVVLALRAGDVPAGLAAAAPPRVILALAPRQASDVARGLSALEAGQGLVVALRGGAAPAR
jgi:hypothetical protein